MKEIYKGEFYGLVYPPSTEYPKGFFVMDSRMYDEETCWTIGLLWPSDKDIEIQKGMGVRVARFVVIEKR